MNRTPSATIFFVQITNYLKWKALHTFIQHISDLNPQNRKQHNTQFQSTLPQGERRHCGIGRCREFYFNPRSHKGSDFISQFFLPPPNNFNPRSHKGSDESKERVVIWTLISIHAPTRGATQRPTSTRRMHEFQSTLPQGERRHSWRCLTQHIRYFNPRSHKGSDVVGFNVVALIYNFNPRSHKGSDEY